MSSDPTTTTCGHGVIAGDDAPVRDDAPAHGDDNAPTHNNSVSDCAAVFDGGLAPFIFGIPIGPLTSPTVTKVAAPNTMVPKNMPAP